METVPGDTRTTPAADLSHELQTSLGSAYTIERELGGGGMSRVFVAEDRALRRKVALKVLPRDLAGEISGDRFRREVLLSAQLQHPHIVPVLSAGETSSGVPYFTMPFVEGESLRARLAARGALPVSEAIAILRDVARALAYAHDRGVVHRDIKPDNVLLADRAALVADFGVAKALASARGVADPDPGNRETGTPLTRTGVSLGTPTYMAPEQLAADPAADHRMDVYAFGATAYEALTGRPPFAGLGPQQLLIAQMTQVPEPVSVIRPDVPPSLSELVSRCLEKAPDARPASGAALLEALDAIAPSGRHQSSVAPASGPRVSLGRAWALYVAAFAAAAGLAYVAMVQLGLPGWVLPGVLIVMALGLPPMVLGARGSLTWRRVALGGAAALGLFALAVIGYMASRLMGIGPAASLLAAGALDDRARMLISEFAAAPNDSVVAAVATEAFRTDFAQSPAVTLPSSGALRTALQRMQRPPTTAMTSEVARELARREGIKVVVEGDVRPVGGGYIISTRLVAPATGEVLAAFRETAADAGQIVGAIDRLSKQARAKVGESLESVRAAPSLERVTTTSFDALQKYSLAMAANRRGEPPQRVMQLLTEAVGIDSTFAMAYAQMCCLGTLPTSGAIRMGALAMKYRERLPAAERYHVEMVQYMTANELDSLITSSRNALDLDSLDAAAFHSLGIAYGRRRQFAAAEQHYVRANVADSVNGETPSHIRFMALARVQYMQGKVAEARQTLQRGRALLPRRALLAVGLSGLDVAVGRYDEADRQLREFLAAAPSEDDRALIEDRVSAMHLLRGRMAAVLAGIDALAANLARRGPPGNALGAKLTAALYTLHVLNDTATARRRLGDALSQDPLDSIPAADRPYQQLARLRAMLGDSAGALATVKQYEASTATAIGRRSSVQGDQFAHTRAIIARERRDYRQAIALAREADVGNCPTCALYLLGSVYDRAGMPDSAIAVYRRAVTLPNWERVFDGSSLALTHERLGQLYERSGDKARAAEHYAEFIELWKGADPALQVRVRAAREALARLRPA